MGILFNATKSLTPSDDIDFAAFYREYYLPHLEELKKSGELKTDVTTLDNSIFPASSLNLQECFDSFCTARHLPFGDFQFLQERLMAKYATHPLVFREDGSVDLAKTWSTLDDENKGATLLSAMYVSVFTRQSKTKAKIGPLVPLYFAAHKQFNNIPYSKFIVKENFNYFINFMSPALLALVQYTFTEDGKQFFSDYPESYEVIGPLRKSLFKWGGQQKDYRTFDKVSKLRDSGLNPKTPGYAVHVALQSWAAYPGNWKDTFNEKYALLNPVDWDTPPVPIWGDEPVAEKQEVKTFKFGRSSKFRDSQW